MRMFTTLRSGEALRLPPLLHRLLVLGMDVLDVLPDEALGVAEVVATLTEDVGRVEGCHRLRAVVQVVPLAAVFGDLEVLVYDGLGGGTAEAEDYLRLHRLHLALEVGVAGPYLGGLGLAVLHPSALRHGGPALDGVREVDLVAGEVDRGEDVVEELAGPAHEGQPRGVLVLAGSLSDEHERRVRVAAGEDRVRAGHGEVAPRADGDLPRQVFQPFLQALAAVRGVEETLQNSS